MQTYIHCFNKGRADNVVAILQHKCQMGLWQYKGMMPFCGVPQKIHFHLPFPFLFYITPTH